MHERTRRPPHRNRPDLPDPRQIRSSTHQPCLVTSVLTKRIPGTPEEMRKRPSRAANALPSTTRASAPRRDGMRCIALSRETGGIQRKYIVSRAMQTVPVPPGSRGPIEERRKGIAPTPASARSSTRIPPHPYRTVLPSVHCFPSSVGFLFLVSMRFTTFLRFASRFRGARRNRHHGVLMTAHSLVQRCCVNSCWLVY
jgi:hypothetical protein